MNKVERYFYPALFTYEPDQPSIRMAQVNRSVNRTVTLPAWLNAAALERNVNFSQILQDALRKELHLG